MLTDEQRAALAKVLGLARIAIGGQREWIGLDARDRHMGNIGSDWDLLGAVLMKLRERGASWMLRHEWFSYSKHNSLNVRGKSWTAPADLLAAIADACKELE